MGERIKAKKLDLLNGPIWSKIPQFALPVAATGILEQLFNASDIAIVGNFASTDRTVAIAAVGANSPIIGMILNLFIGISLGTNVVIANAIGRRDDIRIYLVGMPVIFLYNFEAAIFRSVGDTKVPLQALALSGMLNVVLNLFFVVLVGRSVDGVAIATVISNAVSALILFFRLLRTDKYIISKFWFTTCSTPSVRPARPSWARTTVPDRSDAAAELYCCVCWKTAWYPSFRSS